MSDAEPTPDVLRLYLGRPYRYHGRDRQGNRVERGLYAPLFFVHHGRTCTDMVCYVGLDGADRGKHYVCELNDWEQRFTLVEGVAPEPALVGRRPVPRVAGAYSTGSGV